MSKRTWKPGLTFVAFTSLLTCLAVVRYYTLLFIAIFINLLVTMIIFTNEGNPNALKLIITAKIAQKSFTVKITKPSGKLFNLPLLLMQS